MAPRPQSQRATPRATPIDSNLCRASSRNSETSSPPPPSTNTTCPRLKTASASATDLPVDGRAPVPPRTGVELRPSPLASTPGCLQRPPRTGGLPSEHPRSASTRPRPRAHGPLAGGPPSPRNATARGGSAGQCPSHRNRWPSARGAQVCVVERQPVGPPWPIRAGHAHGRHLCELQVRQRMQPSDSTLLTAGVLSTGGEPLDRLEQPRADPGRGAEHRLGPRVGIAEYEALVREGQQPVEHVRGHGVSGRRHRCPLLGVEAAIEVRQPVEQPLVLRREKVVTPADRRVERPLPGGHVAWSAAGQRHASRQQVPDGRRRQQ